MIFTSFSILWPANPPPPCLLTLVILRLLLTERLIVVVECTSMLLHLSRLCSVKKSYHLMLNIASKTCIFTYYLNESRYAYFYEYFYLLTTAHEVFLTLLNNYQYLLHVCSSQVAVAQKVVQINTDVVFVLTHYCNLYK